MPDFVHLHLHTEYSLLDGACRINRLVDHVKKLGQRAVAITDHGCMYGVVEFYNACKKGGIKPIIGCEVYVAPRSRFDKVHKLDTSPYHLILLCKNNEGYQNLIKLVSLGYIDGFYNRPRVDLETLRKYSKGLICLSACLAGEIPRKLTAGNYEGAKEVASTYLDIFGKGNYFIEVQDHGIDEQRRILPLLYKLSKETGIGLAATNDCHYIEREDSKMQHVLTCISTNTTVDEPGLEFPTQEFYVKSSEEMLSLFNTHPEAISNTAVIADMCEVEFEFGVTKLPHFKIKGEKDNAAYFRKRCIEGLHRKYGNPAPDEAVKRLEYELGVIEKMGYVDYFLIVNDFIDYARSVDIPVGPGRGSGAGSLAAYCIGITGIDPMRYGLLFERFLNPERVSMPDFDIDFCYERRQEVIEYVVRRYGSDHVAQIITFGTMAARGSIRDAGRAMGIAYNTVDTVAKLIPMELNMTISNAITRVRDLRDLMDSDEQIKDLVETAQKIEGMPRHASTHAAGVVITREPASEYVPLQLNDNAIVTQFPMGTLESLGLLKMDFLGLRTLTVIKECTDRIKQEQPDFDIDRVPLDDTKVFKMLSQGKTQGVFQFESAGMRSVLMRLGPESLEDLIAVISLYRPGPMDSIPAYIENRHNPQLIKYKTPLLKDILDVTYGCIVYQEQVMQICRKLGGYSYGRADLVRRAMSKKKHDVMEQERKAFIYGAEGNAGAVANGVSEKVANEIFDDMSSFASYAFNKSHAAAYAYVSYQTAYLKCHYNKYFMAALLTSILDSTDKVIEYIAECETLGIKMLPPDVNTGDMGFTPCDEGIRFGLLAIKNLGRGAIREILEQRSGDGKYRSLYDFCKRLGAGELNKRGLESLIRSGALDCLGHNRRQMLMVYERVLDAVSAESKRAMGGQIDMFGFMGKEEPDYVEMPKVEEYPLEQLLEMEKEVTGVYVSGHPMSGCADIIKRNGLRSISEILDGAKENLRGFGDRDCTRVAAMLQSKRQHSTRSGKLMAFAVFEDMTGTMEGLIFPEVYENNRHLLNDGAIFALSVTISVREDEDPKLIVDKIVPIEELSDTPQMLYIKLNSTHKEKLREVLEVLKENSGGSKVCIYFEDMRKKTYPKGIHGVKISENVLDKLRNLAGNENIALN